MDDNNLKQEKRGSGMKRKLMAIIMGIFMLTTCVACGTNTKSVDDMSMEEKTVEVDNNDDDDENQIDKSFYTKSMDLSEEDFEQDEEDKSFIDSSNSSNVKKIVTVVLVLLIIALIAYVIYRFI